MNPSGQTPGITESGAPPPSPPWGSIIGHPALIASMLAVITLAVFWPVGSYQYLHYDDVDYVTSNPQVLAGLTPAGVVWAFRGGHAGNWHPLTWLSHMLDVQFFGPGPAASHLVNLAFHTVNTVLLFLVLRGMTGALWRSALVAALFALHPLHVESVAWIAERKDVLSAFFFILTLWAYTKYAQSKSSGLRPCIPPYVLTLTFFALGLMSKPMLVTLPFLMLLVDYWPLKRVQPGTLGALVLEKAPFFVLSAISSVITFNVQQVARQPLINCPMSARIGNGLVAYARYLGKTVWPVNLANPYPLPDGWPLVDVVLAGVLLVMLCLGALFAARKAPFVFTGWFWFVGMLIPVIGLVQVGAQSMADRYTYLPLIGLFIVVVWGAQEALARLSPPLLAVTVVTSVLLVACVLRTRDQVHYWRDSETLFGHAIAVTKDNWLAYYNLGWSSDDAGRLDEALAYYRRSAELKPNYPEVQNNIGFTLVRQGRLEEAVPYFKEAFRLRPSFVDAGDNLGLLLLRLGRTDEAITELRLVLQSNPDHLGALNNLGGALSSKGEFVQALQYYEESLRLKPLQPSIQYNTGNALTRLKRNDEAIEHYRKAIEQKPDYVEAHYALGMALSQKGDLEHAAAEVAEAVRYMPDDAVLRLNLAKLLAAGQRFDEAIAVYKEALRLAPDNPDAHNALGATLATKGDLDGAIMQFQEALRLRPDNASAHFNLGKALATQHKFDEAARQFNEALRLRPDFAAARQELQAMGIQTENSR